MLQFVIFSFLFHLCSKAKSISVCNCVRPKGERKPNFVFASCVFRAGVPVYGYAEFFDIAERTPKWPPAWFLQGHVSAGKLVRTCDGIWLRSYFPVFGAVWLVSRRTRNSHTFAICSNERKLEYSTQLMTMPYGPKKYKPSIFVAAPRVV